MKNRIIKVNVRRWMIMLSFLLCLLAWCPAWSQIVIGGKVFGGARQADVKGSTFVHVGADNYDVLINAVYGGNDISGSIGSSDSIPAAIEQEVANGITEEEGKNTKDYSAFVRISPEKKDDDGNQLHHIFIGNLFGGGNGDYDYTTEGSPYQGKNLPELNKAYLEIQGGTIAYVYGGGNNATVKEATDICIDNHSEVTTAIPTGSDGSQNLLLNHALLQSMGITTLENVILSDTYHFSRVFGGNNKAEMAIRPTWHLNAGHIENLYSGGNEGAMTSKDGLLLEIPATSGILVDNVYGGCRKANVSPMEGNAPAHVHNLPGYNFPEGLSARVIVRGGDINNVYGGNDVSGKVFGGAAVGVYHSIRGSIYGGGNGSYPYTDNADLGNTVEYRDFYYDPGDNSLAAMNAFRPVTESVSIFVKGTSDTERTIIGGSIFCGGNSTTLHNDDPYQDPYSELKIGSYVTADTVFLGNNGANMVSLEVLTRLAAYVSVGGTNYKFSTINLKDPANMDKYMEAVAMDIRPRVVFSDDYVDYSTMFGSIYGGGNVGSMTYEGNNELLFNKEVIVFNKVVGGCNNANVAASENNAAYYGGITGAPDPSTGNKLTMTFNGLKIMPMRWKNPDIPSEGLEFNTIRATEGGTLENTPPQTEAYTGPSTADDLRRRLKGGSVYGGCFQSGHVNGNVVININESIVDRTGEFAIFDEVEADPETGEAKLTGGQYNITQRHSGVILHEQGMDVFSTALNVYGGGYGEDAEIWGSTTINVNKGYVFQVFGGGELGPVGKAGSEGTYSLGASGKKYSYDAKYSTTINLNGSRAGHKPGILVGDEALDDMAEVEFIYGGGFKGLICGDTRVNLGNGRIYNSFAGSCNADILGHTETYVGQWTEGSTTISGFPFMRDHIYGGCDLGGHILGSKDFSSRISPEALPHVYKSKNLEASAYTEYTQGYVGNIFAGCYGDYPYDTDAGYGSANVPKQPFMDNAMVYFRPNVNTNNSVSKIFGAGQGTRIHADKDKMQSRSYVLIDDANTQETFEDMAVFGGGQNCGIGMDKTPAEAQANADSVTAAAVIDLVRGKIGNAYGGSFNQGFTRRTILNVPAGSTVDVNNIFGGAYGEDPLIPCDVYEAQVHYRGENATVRGGSIFGGNNHADRTLYGQVNIYAPVWSNKTKGFLATVYGAGKGEDTWSQYTEVNLENGARVYEVYGGGDAGMVLNLETLKKWELDAQNAGSVLDLSMGDYEENGLDNPLVKTSGAGSSLEGKYNTNVNIKEGATIANYCYGGGLGAKAVVSGTAYVGLLGGTVVKDIYGSGTSGDVRDMRGVKTGFTAADGTTSIAGFTASANVYIKGGMVRNVYGSGWRGGVGYHQGELFESNDHDILGETNVVIGDVNGTDFQNGIPAVTRNVYGGGEGGPVYGMANVTVNNGWVGYRYKDGNYVEELDDVAPGDNLLDEGGNVFGGGYVANSYTDSTNVNMYGGIVRGCLYGGGEIGPVGRGTVHPDSLESRPDDPSLRKDPSGKAIAAIYKGGSTKITLWKGHVMRDVFGGGRGFDNWNGEGYMTNAEKLTMDKSSKGYVFGSTDVHIRGGEIGTRAGVNQGFGNVFGGGNVGFVYSAEGTKKGQRSTIAVENLENGLPIDGGGYYYKTWNGSGDGELSLDCNVVVEPYCEVTAEGGITIDNHYEKGQFVPIEELNKLGNKEASADQWNLIDWESGVTIHNAVFAGGNVVKGSDVVSVNTATVYGNVTAALRDAFNRDLITLGTEHVGGLYGDGNLTFVDGWRELHIDNYGTDYYNNDETITVENYNSMSDRERAYFVLNYRAKNDISVTGSIEDSEENIHITKNVSILAGDRFTADTFKETFLYDYYNNPNYPDAFKNYINADGSPNPAYFEELGFCSIYAGRLLNTLQRCDMAAVWGSRIVLQGARDRVPEKADYTRYTINRVGELSLNQRENTNSTATGSVKHGNYFGIYSIVNYLGNLTSDVFFTETAEHSSAVRETNNTTPDNQKNGDTYYKWKLDHKDKANRNNGTSANLVSLASGVYLEIIREESEKVGHTEWGLITGVVQLDLIDVKTGQGGGYVYARNQHGAKTWHPDWSKVNLSPYNLTARTYKRFTYDESDANLKEIETSGNFVHYTKQIVDDCYPNASAYKGAGKSPAHYWYIRGSIYVYDQYISAYTGSANAYAKTVSIPLTISAASHGKMTLREVQPNRYAYYDKEGNALGDGGTVIINDITYKAGDPIDYWTYQSLSDIDQGRFVDDVYTTISKCLLSKESTDTIFADHILLPTELTTLRGRAPLKRLSDEEDAPEVPAVYDPEQEKYVAFDFVFRPANNIGHDTGYALTFDSNNPVEWDKYYSLKSGRGSDGKLSITTEEYVDKDGYYHTAKDNYLAGPTYSPKESGVYAQRNYNLGEIIPQEVYDSYVTNVCGYVGGRDDQAAVEPAFVVTTEFSVKDKNGMDRQFYPGSPLYESGYDATTWSSLLTDGKIAEAKVCTSTLKITDTDYLFAGTLLSPADIADLKTRIVAAGLTTAQDADHFLGDYYTGAYYCTKSGLYGGNYFTAGKPYRAIDTWNTMSAADRENFLFNYDAFDLLIDPTYGGGYGNKYQYDGYRPGSSSSATTPQYDGCTPLSPKIYSLPQYIDYRAEYVGDGTNPLTYTDGKGVAHEILCGDTIGRREFESIPNERAHWSPITVDKEGDYYVVKQAFIRGDMPYTVGQTIASSVYDALSGEQKSAYIDVIHFNDEQAGTSQEPKHYFFCRESYVIGEHGEGVGFTNMGVTGTIKDYHVGDKVDSLIVINEENFNALKNMQTGFVIHGTSPEETATLYVTRESDCYDLQKEKIITVVYLYEYQESDESGRNITPISERHVINLHINFESGVPEIGVLTKPNIVLPGTTVGLKIPNVEPGAFEITSSGWEMFANASDAALHTNGQPFYNNASPVYWYQNGYYVAYYAKTYLGKTYSNAVPFSVANYHDLKAVMDDKQHHYYIDHKDVDREPKIYINDYTADGQSGLLMLKDLIDLTNGKSLDGHSPLKLDNEGKEMRSGGYLELFLRSNQEFTGTGWTPIANGEGECFSGNLHGDGHYVKGLDQSLFGHLCGSVYNLGVMGSFTSGGIADTGDGYVGNSWAYTTGAADASQYAVFGNPTAGGDWRQINNCYYYAASGDYKQDGSAHGLARKMSQHQFLNGEVAYNLNGSYLHKRYYDHEKPQSGDTYSYYVDGTDAEGNSTLTLKNDGRYGEDYQRYVYVEDRFKDGDFIYANGTIPETDNIRLHVNEDTEEAYYYPIWPDDYLFFGQVLNYGHVTGLQHQDVPSALNRSGGRMVTNSGGNRVYRAPAYFRSNAMSQVFFNPYAVFPATGSVDGVQQDVYKNMTAIDFTGYQDRPYALGTDAGGLFFPPMLDYDGLTGFVTDGLTKNLLVYADPVNDDYSYSSVLERALPEATLSLNASGKYNEVKRPSDGSHVNGHLVALMDGSYLAQRDHYLVDKEDFYAPIGYRFAADRRMWYQRQPDNYVDLTKGWEGVSLPFTADLVTTQDKGELTHFFQGSTTGHEYWLRQFEGHVEAVAGQDGVYKGDFNYPAASGDAGKTVRNPFLWDYYYMGLTHNQQDKNTDIYQTYYNNPRNYDRYPRLTAAVPYIIGLPGKTYYEFDLSGEFVASTTLDFHQPAKLQRQVITFASATGAAIQASADELRAVTPEGCNYSFVPNYLNTTLDAGHYALDGDGASFTVISGNASTDATRRVSSSLPAFRPYFSTASVGGAPARRAAQYIVFGSSGSSFGIDDSDLSGLGDDLAILPGQHKAVVTSHLRKETDVRIFNVSGLCVASFTIEPGQTVDTSLPVSGIYVVQADGGRYMKKIAVK